MSEPTEEETNASSETATQPTQPEEPQVTQQVRPNPGIHFRGPYTGAAVSSTFVLRNPTELVVAFKIKTTDPNRYRVRPAIGILQADASVNIRLQMKPVADEAAFAELLSTPQMFLVQTVAVRPELADNTVKQIFTATTAEQIGESIFRCVFDTDPAVTETAQSEDNPFVGLVVLTQDGLPLVEAMVETSIVVPLNAPVVKDSEEALPPSSSTESDESNESEPTEASQTQASLTATNPEDQDASPKIDHVDTEDITDTSSKIEHKKINTEALPFPSEAIPEEKKSLKAEAADFSVTIHSPKPERNGKDKSPEREVTASGLQAEHVDPENRSKPEPTKDEGEVEQIRSYTTTVDGIIVPRRKSRMSKSSLSHTSLKESDKSDKDKKDGHKAIEVVKPRKLSPVVKNLSKEKAVRLDSALAVVKSGGRSSVANYNAATNADLQGVNAVPVSGGNSSPNDLVSLAHVSPAHLSNTDPSTDGQLITVPVMLSMVVLLVALVILYYHCF